MIPFVRMCKRYWIVATLVFLGCFRDSQPNVILVMTDDQGYGDFGFTGNPVIRTPHLDALAARSANMTNFFVSPVCAPTRASLMTGRYNQRTRVVDTWMGRALMDPEEITIAEVLSSEGYSTGIFGKWHLGDNYPMRPQDQGFDEVLVHRGGGIAQPSDPPGGQGKYTDPVLFHNGEQFQADGYCTDVYFDYALDWIEEQADSRQPFFAYISTNAPHDPAVDVPEALFEDYRQLDLGNDQFPQEYGHALPVEADLERRAGRFAMISNIDENIGRLIERLDALEISQNTLVIFLVDNGPDGRRYVAGFRGSKGSVYDGGIRSPLLMHWPDRLLPGTHSLRPVAHIDLMPTILEAAGVDSPDGLSVDGRSFLSLLTEDNPEWPERTLVIQGHRGDVPVRYHNFMIRNNKWKLLHNSGFWSESFEGDPAFELYDLEADLYEETDIAAEYPDVVEELLENYDRWFDDVGSSRSDNYAKMRIHVGSAFESPTVLTRNDWQQTNRASWWSAEALGFWEIEVTETDSYDFFVRYPPGTPEGTATITVNDAEYSATSSGDVDGVWIRDVPLEVGPIRLSATIDIEGNTGGAWQVEVIRKI